MGNIYTGMKVFHYKDKIDSLVRESDVIMPPIHVRLKPTNVCCHNCRYCAYRADGLQLGRDMDVRDSIPQAKMMEILDDLIDMKVQAVTFSGGGEPFCYPHLMEAAEKLSDSGISFAALTNGARLKGDIARVFANNAVWVRVSIDGWDGESYSKYRGVSTDEFAKVIRNIEEFQKVGGSCVLGGSIIVDRENAGHIYDLISTLYNAGVNSVKISPCIVSNDGSENNDYHERNFDIVKEQIARAENDFTIGGFEIYDSYHRQLESFAKEHDWCPYLQILPVIGADQNVYSCQDKAYNLDEGLIGSIRDVSFREFWELDKAKFFRINPSMICNHHCVADGKNRMILDYLGADERHRVFV